MDGKDIVQTGEGRAVLNSGKWTYEYDLKDHLGNTRVSFGIDTIRAVPLQYKDYYPFGLEMAQNYANNANATKYRYNGKELQDEGGLDMYDYGARFYDPAIGRWHTPDPKAEEYFGWSPYNYVTNNPIKMVDPDGRSGEVSIDQKNRTLTITANLILYGSKASAELAKQYAKNASSMWNSAGTKVTIGKAEYTVKFNITGDYREDGKSLKNEISNNTDIKNNYLRVDNETDRTDNASHVDEFGGNSAYINQEQNVENGNTTVPHELGHLFGLVHPDNIDQRGSTPPDIMTTNGYWGAKGYSDKDGFVNTAQREVTKGNINSIGLSKLQYDKTGKANLGYTSNTYYSPSGVSNIKK